MIIEDCHVNAILRSIDLLYIQGRIGISDADDLTTCVIWLVGKSMNESNIQYAINNLRGYKSVMDDKSVSSVINSIRQNLGKFL